MLQQFEVTFTILGLKIMYKLIKIKATTYML